jgi:hypothetical protein
MIPITIEGNCRKIAALIKRVLGQLEKGGSWGEKERGGYG